MIGYEVSKEFVAEDEYDTIMRRGYPGSGDLPLTTEAPLGHAFLIDRERVALPGRRAPCRSRLSTRWPRRRMRPWVAGRDAAQRAGRQMVDLPRRRGIGRVDHVQPAADGRHVDVGRLHREPPRAPVRPRSCRIRIPEFGQPRRLQSTGPIIPVRYSSKKLSIFSL